MNTILFLLLLQAGCVPVGAGLSGTVVVPDAGLAFHVWVCPGVNPRPDPEPHPEPELVDPPSTPRRERAL